MEGEAHTAFVTSNDVTVPAEESIFKQTMRATTALYLFTSMMLLVLTSTGILAVGTLLTILAVTLVLFLIPLPIAFVHDRWH